LLQGVVIKAYNSFYYVQTEDNVTMCTLRGRFKKDRFSLIVGDEVEYVAHSRGKGVIETILPRRTLLQRPLVANVDQVVLTFAAVNPDVSTSLLDRFLVVAESSELKVIICLNKIDLINVEELASLVEIYRNIGYPLILASAKLGTGIAELRTMLQDKITAFAGPSGAGKSTMLNAVQPGLALVTGAVSEKIGRGKHTTRFAHLLPLAGGGHVVDTPGFSATDFSGIAPTALSLSFPEIAAVASECKFTSCLHYKEPQCAVKQAVQENKIARSRYESYLTILEEIRSQKKVY
jgi:ribosome biogenesis GTPase